MSLTLTKILAAAPATTRGQPTPLSVDPKGLRIAYPSGKSIFVRSIDDPSDTKQYTGHTAPTTVARFSPSGFYIASGDATGQLRIWDSIGAETTKGEYPIISGRINDVAWDGDSQRVIAVGDGRERFGACITADSGNSVGEITGHSKAVNAVAIRQMRPIRAATVGDDGALCFMNGVPFKFAAKRDGTHRGFIYAVSFSGDGESVVSAGADGKVVFYDGKTGEVGRVIEGAHGGSIFSVAWTGDSKKVVTAGADQTVKVWDVSTGELVKKWRMGSEGVVSVGDQQVGVAVPAGRSDSLIIAINLNGDLTYLEMDKDEPIRIIHGHNKATEALTKASDQEDTLYTGSFDGRVCSWSLSTGLATPLSNGHSNRVTGFSSFGRQTVSIGWDDALRTIDNDAGTFLGAAVKLAGQPQGVARTKEGVFVALSTDEVAFYKEGELAGSTKLGYTPTCIAAGDGYIVVGGDGNLATVYKLSGTTLEKVTTLNNPTSPVTLLVFSPKSDLLAVGTRQGKILVYTVSPTFPLLTDRWSAHTARVTCLAWNSEATHAVSGGLDSNLHLWSIAKPGSRVKVGNAHKDGVVGVAWGKGAIVSTGADAAVKVWEGKL